MTEEEKTILLTRHDGQLQRQEGRIKELERRQDDLEKLASSVAMLAQRQEDMDAAKLWYKERMGRCCGLNQKQLLTECYIKIKYRFTMKKNWFWME